MHSLTPSPSPTGEGSRYLQDSLATESLTTPLSPWRGAGGEALLTLLLRDRTTGRNIFWATHDYEQLGSGYQYADEIRPESITGEHANIVKPRVWKSKEQQTDRSKDMAEVFTPSWICDAQNNLVDEAWRGEQSGTWEDYVRQTVLEITCGEAPYLVSRYDTTTGDPIPLQKRIGLLDRKMHTINEHASSPDDWLRWVETAYQNTYGYEWQGDNLLLARINLLSTFIECYQDRFHQEPAEQMVRDIADIVSWNLWQMDGLRGTPPDYPSPGEILDHPVPDMFTTYCVLRDWENGKTIRYIDLINSSL